MTTASPLALIRTTIGDFAPVVTTGVKRFVLFVSFTDGSHRAKVFAVTAATSDGAWQQAEKELASRPEEVCLLRVDHVVAAERSSWAALRMRLKGFKRNYFRAGISLDADFEQGFLETEINANAMLYGGPTEDNAVLNKRNFSIYAAKRHGLRDLVYPDQGAIWLFTTSGAFVGEDGVVHQLSGSGPDAGRRTTPPLDADGVLELIGQGSGYLASQVQDNGRFVYGRHPCFDREIRAYNSLRHASSLYAMLEAWEVTGGADLESAIDRGLACLTSELIEIIPLPDGASAAFLVDTGAEIKLGGNAVAILALVKHRQLTGDDRHALLLDRLAAGILYMQDQESGRFAHVLNFPALDVKQDFRTIYYDGEAAFGLMRLFEQTSDPRWLAAVELAFGYFIQEDHGQAHDHWLSYCVNELTKYRPTEEYFRFGLSNFKDHLTFVLERVTTFPTLLELMMAAEKMIARLRTDAEHSHLLEGVDLPRFYKAMHHRANYLLNGFFWPELAMFFPNPHKITGSFFIRHHSFRIRIDDVEHYLSGLIAYRNYLLGSDPKRELAGSNSPKNADGAHWTAHDVARATGGHWISPPAPGWSASGLCKTPLTMQAGDMVAVRLADKEIGIGVPHLAHLRNPPSALIAREEAGHLFPPGDRLVVDNVGDAVLALGRYARERMTGKILAVTGSAGKTTAVSMLAHALSAYGAVGQTRYNANLPHGIAWNLASLSWDTPHIVLELAIGRMARNARLARPDIAVFTNILPAHLEYHRDLATIVRKKSAIFGAMQPGGVAVLNRGMEHWEHIHMAAKLRGLETISYGIHDSCDARLIRYNPENGEIVANVHGRKICYSLDAPGQHMVLNSLAVLAAVSAAGQDLAPAVARLRSFLPVSGRGKIYGLSFGESRVTMIDDAYNANPGSMGAALSLLGDMETTGRKVAILGEMLELGPETKKYHRMLVPLIDAHGIDRVHAIGTLYDDFWHALPVERRGYKVNKMEELEALLTPELQDGDLLLIKGSQGTGMHKLVDWLRSVADSPAARPKLERDRAS